MTPPLNPSGRKHRFGKAWMHEHVNDHWVQEAKRQLVFTNQAIHDIAYALGFADPSHFTRFFRKSTAMTPQSFRESHGG